jgi:hypothetical protein
MEFVLQKLPVQASDLSLSIRNPLLVYGLLALYGLLTVALMSYVHSKFRASAKALSKLQTDWQSAQSNHATFIGVAQEKLSKLSAPPTPAIASVPKSGGIGLEMRHQIVSMAKRGMRTLDIARACGLTEGEAEVILSMARLER